MTDNRARVCEWVDGDVSYQVRATHVTGIVLTALGPGTIMRVVPLRQEDGFVTEWSEMTLAQRTLRAERILQRL